MILSINYTSFLPAHFPLHRIAAWVNVFIVLLLAYTLSDLTWTAVTGMSVNRTVPLVESKLSDFNRSSSAQGLDKVADLHLLGANTNSEKKVTVAPIDAPETRLNLVLKGVFSADSQENAVVIIANKGHDEKSYRVGDVVGGAAQIYKIYPDRVILKRGDNFETLALPRDEPLSGNSIGNNTSAYISAASDNSKASTHSHHLRGLRQKILAKPGAAMRLVNAQPVMESGGLKGYRVSPGQNRELFARAGLRPGDVVTAVNGVEITNMKNMQQLYQQVKKGGRFVVSVERGGKPLSLTLEID
jgi:general secretion pathway protein C